MTDPACPSRISRHRFAGLVVFLIYAAHSAVAPSSFGVEPSDDDLRVTPVVRAIQNAEKSVVDIQGNKTVAAEGRRSGEKETVHGMGTGVIIDERGYIVTNLHVVQDVSRIEVTTHDGTKAIAKLINYDPDTDLALIKISNSANLNPIEIGTSHDLLRGEQVIAIGNPYGYQHSVTVGIISAMHRDVPVNGTQVYEDLIQTNADINPGNSGGPLVNIHGEMIGINVAVRMGAQGIGFAIPVDNALNVIADLVAASTFEERSLGVRVKDDFTGDTPAVEVLVSNNQLRSGDIVRSIEGREIRSRLDVQLALLDYQTGDSVTAEVQRDGMVEEIEVSVGGRSSQSFDDIASVAWKRLGLRLKQVSSTTMPRTQDGYQGGFRIEAIRENSPASKQPIRKGDVLVGIMKWQTPSTSHLDWVLKNSEFQRTEFAKIFVVRGQNTYHTAIKLSPSDVR